MIERILLLALTAFARQNAAQECDPALIAEVKSYQPIADLFLKSALEGDFKGRTFAKTAEFVDKFQHRILGSQVLEDSLDWLITDFQNEYPFDKIWKEEVPDVPHWVRGQESATLLSPIEKNLNILSLGSSVGTSLPDGITAEAVVVTSFDELKALGAEKVQGKIVVYNQGYTTYGAVGAYRFGGASEASRLGAVAAMVQSLTPYSLNSPHTGHQVYAADITPIPAISITMEDAEMLKRIYDRGETIVINIKSEAQNLPPTTANNLIADYNGTIYPEKYIIVSGHIDNWDVGQGALDDAAGAFIGATAVNLIHATGVPRPKRTIRNVFWTGEEFGLIGANHYFEEHKAELEKFIFVMESDEGTFTPQGLYFGGDKNAGECIIKEIVNMFQLINATSYEWSESISTDVSVFTDVGVPGAGLMNEPNSYFNNHHSDGDTMTVEDSEALDKIVALWATTAYVVADLSIDFPPYATPSISKTVPRTCK